MRLDDELPNAHSVLALSRAELAGIILERRNAEADRDPNSDRYHWVERDFQRYVHETYRSNDVLDRFAEAFQYMRERGFVAEDVHDLNSGWFRLTGSGRTMKRRDMVPHVRVPRDFNPGPTPDFMAIVGRPDLAKHLVVVWEEAVICIQHQAWLAALVMLGSLLEGALLGRALADPNAAFSAPSAPKRKGQVIQDFRWWYLSNFIEVGTELNWLHQNRGDFADVLREYRNLVHPFTAMQMYRVDEGMVRTSWEVVMAALVDLGLRRP